MLHLTSLLAILLILVVLMILSYTLAPTASKTSKVSKFTMSDSELKGHQCTTKCTNIDPVSEPEYNMKEIAKQSILLEEHLTQKNKRCRDCISKHFLHIMALQSEAIWLAGDRVSEYPLLEETTGFYSSLFDEWLNDQNNEEKILEISGKLRDMRKKIVAVYVLHDKLW